MSSSLSADEVPARAKTSPNIKAMSIATRPNRRLFTVRCPSFISLLLFDDLFPLVDPSRSTSSDDHHVHVLDDARRRPAQERFPGH
jgi:hypothetical protein